MQKSNYKEKLLGDKRVVEEINRHLWFESEKVGYDIGFENAKQDWLKKFSKAWMSYHAPEWVDQSDKAPKATSRKTKTKQKAAPKKRRAKSYLE